VASQEKKNVQNVHRRNIAANWLLLISLRPTDQVSVRPGFTVKAESPLGHRSHPSRVA